MVVDKAGYGLTGTGTTGAIAGTFGTLRSGQNEYDSFADLMLMAFGLTPTSRPPVTANLFSFTTARPTTKQLMRTATVNGSTRKALTASFQRFATCFSMNVQEPGSPGDKTLKPKPQQMSG